MNTYKIFWSRGIKTGDNLIKAESEESANAEFKKEYSDRKILATINCSTPHYQMDYDNEQFDSNGRRKF